MLCGPRSRKAANLPDRGGKKGWLESSDSSALLRECLLLLLVPSDDFEAGERHDGGNAADGVQILLFLGVGED